MAEEMNSEEIHRAVREHYGEAARQVWRLDSCDCGPTANCCGSPTRLYDPELLRELPEAAVRASLGCGNPLLLADLQPGEVVLDLGSGGGIDVLLSARRVGPGGRAYGLDMTDEMLALARENAQKAGVTNVEFLKGQMESIPLPDASVDVVISNCVINLSPDKRAVLAEAWRVLRPGGRLAVADIVVLGRPLSPEMREQMSLWAECVSGAITEEEYRAELARAGFDGITLQELEVYGQEDAQASCCCSAPAAFRLDPGSRIVSAFIRATKPE